MTLLREIEHVKPSMARAEKIAALVRSHIAGDDDHFYAVAIQLASEEARLGHARVARELRDLVQAAKESPLQRSRGVSPVPITQPKGDLASLLSVTYPDTRLSDMVLPEDIDARLSRVLLEQNQREALLARNLLPRRKLLFLGPPGSGKTMAASALAGELRLPLFTILLEGLITKTASKLRQIFDALAQTRAVYLFDEFDAIGARRDRTNDVGEIRRVLNSFLQLLEKDPSQSVIIAATNHPDMLDRALFRRFDDLIEFDEPDAQQVVKLLRARLAAFDTKAVKWNLVIEAAVGLNRSEIVRASEDAAKEMVLNHRKAINTQGLLAAVAERKVTGR
jgi:SpoVK/Ycf46/Vps4 family AAA+-type ATPase